MRKTAALTIATLMLAGCQAKASDDRNDDEVIGDAVLQVMCAANDQDRAAYLAILATQMDRYRPDREDDSAASAVDIGLQGWEDEGCPPLAKPER